MTVNIMKTFGKEYLGKYFMTGQSLPLKMFLQWKMGFENGQNLCLLQEITALPRGTCAFAALSRFLCQTSYTLQVLSGSTYCHSNAAAEVPRPKEKSQFPSQCKKLFNLRIRMSFCDTGLRHFWPPAEESWLSVS